MYVERFNDWTMKRFMEEESLTSPMVRSIKKTSLQNIISKMMDDSSFQKDNNTNIILTALQNTSYEDEGVKLAVDRAIENLKYISDYLEKSKESYL